MYPQNAAKFPVTDGSQMEPFSTAPRGEGAFLPAIADALDSMHALASSLAGTIGSYVSMRDSKARRPLVRQELQRASVNLSGIIRRLHSGFQRATLDRRGFDTNLYGYVANNPLLNIDPAGLAFIDCKKAVEDLTRVAKRAQQHYAQNIANWPPDKGHVKEKAQIATELGNAYAKVVKHCACWVGEEILEELKTLVEKLKEQVDAFCQAITDRRFLAALLYLMAALAILAALLALLLLALAPAVA